MRINKNGKPCYTIAVGNQKGGVGKSVISMNLALSLCNTYGKNVLLIDTDSQGSSSLTLNEPVQDDDYVGLEGLLIQLVRNPNTKISWEEIKEYIVTPGYPKKERKKGSSKWEDVMAPFGEKTRFDLLPATLGMTVVDLEMGIAGGKTNYIFSGYLTILIQTIVENSDYDFIVIDEPPALGSLSMNANTAADDGVIIATNLDMLSFRGIPAYKESVKSIQESNPKHRGVIGIVYSEFSEYRTVDRFLDDYIRRVQRPVLGKISQSVQCKRAHINGQLFSQVSKVAKKQFDEVAANVIDIVEDKVTVGELEARTLEEYSKVGE